MDILSILNAIVHYGPHVIAIASAISAVTPVPQGTNKVLHILSSIINVLALNVGEAKKVPHNPPPDQPNQTPMKD
jgi:hypothetical protein